MKNEKKMGVGDRIKGYNLVNLINNLLTYKHGKAKQRVIIVITQ